MYELEDYKLFYTSSPQNLYRMKVSGIDSVIGLWSLVVKKAMFTSVVRVSVSDSKYANEI